MNKFLTIALDYDLTYTADKETFKKVIITLQLAGHKIYCVTMRSFEHDFHPDFDELLTYYNIETIFCDGHAKRVVCETLGIPIDIWIDDKPQSVVSDSEYSPEELHAWRKTQAA